MYNVNASSGIVEAKTVSGKYLLVAAGMQIRKSFTEFNFLTVNGNGTIGAFSGSRGHSRQMIRIDAELPVNIGFFEFQESGSLVVFVYFNFILFYIAEDPC